MDNKDLGRLCKQYRERLCKTQSDVAADVGYSKETVSAFETGRNNNAIIFCWYVRHGFKLEVYDGK